jgi:hypothetical protein
LRAQHVKWSASNISCPFQNSINGGNCNYVHINIKPRKIKQFSQLMDFVCGRDRLHQNLSNVVSSNVPMTMKARKKVLSALYRISGVLPRYLSSLQIFAVALHIKWKCKGLPRFQY